MTASLRDGKAMQAHGMWSWSGEVCVRERSRKGGAQMLGGFAYFVALHVTFTRFGLEALNVLRDGKVMQAHGT